MGTFQDKVVIVTGASEGIGRALCIALAPQKPKLVLAARNQDRLEELKIEVESKGAKAMESRDRLAILSARGKLGRWVKLIAPRLIDKAAQKAIRDAR